jgi:hypothetical protein
MRLAGHPIMLDRLSVDGVTKRLLPGKREDGAMPPSVETCAVCHRSQTRGSRNQDGDIFICAGCQADAEQFIEIQDTLWLKAGVAGESTDGATMPTQP